MNTAPASRKPLPLIALLCAAVFLVSPLHDAGAEPGQQEGQEQTASNKGTRNYGVGGTSLRLRDIWGPPKMPPAPMDFGPHFDYPPAPLNGAPLHDPYPH
jgi:hypothetical protein